MESAVVVAQIADVIREVVADVERGLGVDGLDRVHGGLVAEEVEGATVFWTEVSVDLRR